MGRKRPSYVEMQQQRFRARKMLAEFCAEHLVSQRDLVEKANFKGLVRLRRRFVRIAYFEGGCGLKAIASAIKRDTSTVDYHVRGMRKKRREKKRQYDAVRRAAPEPVAHV